MSKADMKRAVDLLIELVAKDERGRHYQRGMWVLVKKIITRDDFHAALAKRMEETAPAE